MSTNQVDGDADAVGQTSCDLGDRKFGSASLDQAALLKRRAILGLISLPERSDIRAPRAASVEEFDVLSDMLYHATSRYWLVDVKGSDILEIAHASRSDSS